MLQVGRGDTKAAARTVEEIGKNVESEFPELLLAQCYVIIGDRAGAERAYQDALRKRPGDVRVLTAMASFYESARNPDQAEATLRKIRQADPSVGWATRKLALSLASRGGVNRDAWEEALRLVGPEPRPDDVTDDRVTRAAVYALSPDPAQRRKAVAILEAVLAELPALVRVHEDAARLLASLGETGQALAHAAKAADNDRAPAAAILLYAGLLLDAKDLKGAEAQLDRLVALDPNSLPVAEIKARLLAARGQGAEGAATLEKAFGDRAKAPEALAVAEKMTPLLLELGQPEAAGRVAHKAASVGPRGRCVLADYLDRVGKPGEAEAELNKAAGDDPGAAAATAWNLAGRHSGDAGARARWADLARRADAAARPRDAAAALAGPALEQQFHKDAQFHHLKGEYDKEVEVYKRWLKSNPSNFMFMNNAAWTYSEEMTQPEEGLKWIGDAIKKMGPQPFLLDTRGVILLRLKRFDDAERDLKTVEKGKTRDDPTLDYHLFRLYKKWGKPDEARKYRERAEKAGLKRDQLQPSELADWETVAEAR
jgi:tetratricopeptide (TPR) repeat protein